MIIGKVPSLNLKIDKDSRYGEVVVIHRNKCKNQRIMRLRDDSLLVEGAKLYNSVPRCIREFDGSFLGFKNLIDAWLKFIPDIPRVCGNEPEGRNAIGMPSNSVRDWMCRENFVRMNTWECSNFVLTGDHDVPD